ncbi:30S ribosomal protein S4 [Sulfobacillus harzensis]|uniref:Small ribosomal subunit protein uS4 n=1 Tax=Sulfobacillus harzensis TaxID=2729629 RepID=A0A7Y0Q3X5_9FIRM|nr:30S ribosomal protein S4 [Sulfobacillus harzensis]NMP24017.1 30S ribosomal protein S4 [Sulfobacillus harzensis]
MARLTGPKHRLCRRAGIPLCGSPKCPALKRPYPPGQHGRTRRQRQSEYGLQLLEKQKLKAIYGVKEKQFKRYYAEAQRRKGVTGDTLVMLLETRLDNIVRRLGFARSIHGARQLVTHGHITVNGRRVDIPSFHVRVGDVIGLTERGAVLKTIDESRQQAPIVPPYLAFDPETRVGQLARQPLRSEIPVNISESLVVEYFSR